MKRTMLLVLIATLTLAFHAPAGAESPSGTSPLFHEGALSNPGDKCLNGSSTYYWTLDGWFAGNEAYRILCAPAACSGCEGGWKPISVTMYLYWEDRNECALTVQAELHEASPGGAGPPDQGRVVAVSEPTRVGPFHPAGLWAVTVAMPHDCPIIDGPVLATLRFLDTCDELPALVAAPGACDARRSWIERGQGWSDLHDRDLPGNLSAYTTFECQGMSPVEPVAWATIKGRYSGGSE